MMTFRFVSTFTATICIVLFGILLVAPASYTSLYGVVAGPGGAFLGNRAAPMFLGLASICWLLRAQSARDVQMAVGLSMAAIFGGIALTGLWAYIQGIASASILLAAGGECIVVGAYLLVLFSRA